MGLTPDWHCPVSHAAAVVTAGPAVPISSRALLCLHGRGECQAPPEPQPRHPGTSLDAMVCPHARYGLFPSSRKGTQGVPCVPALEDAHFGVAAHLWGPFPACIVGYNALKAIQPPRKLKKNYDGHYAPGARSCSTCHRDTLMAARVTLTLQLGTQRCPHGYCYHSMTWPTFPAPRRSRAATSKLIPSWCHLPQFIPGRDVAGATGCPPPAPGSSRGVRARGQRRALRGGSWAGDDGPRGSEELCTSGFLTLSFNIPPQPDGKNK